MIRALEHARVTLSMEIESAPTILHILTQNNNKYVLFGTTDGRIGLLDIEEFSIIKEKKKIALAFNILTIKKLMNTHLLLKLLYIQKKQPNFNVNVRLILDCNLLKDGLLEIKNIQAEYLRLHHMI